MYYFIYRLISYCECISLPVNQTLRNCVNCIQCEKCWTSFSVTKSLFHGYCSLLICRALLNVLSYSLHYAIKCLRQNSLVLKTFSGILPQVIIEVMKYPIYNNTAFYVWHACFASPHSLKHILRHWVVFSDRNIARSEWRHCATSQLLPRSTRKPQWLSSACKWVQASCCHANMAIGIPHGKRICRIVLYCHMWPV